MSYRVPVDETISRDSPGWRRSCGVCWTAGHVMSTVRGNSYEFPSLIVLVARGRSCSAVTRAQFFGSLPQRWLVWGERTACLSIVDATYCMEYCPNEIGHHQRSKWSA